MPLKMIKTFVKSEKKVVKNEKKKEEKRRSLFCTIFLWTKISLKPV
jgi:hypothetical protein